MRVNGGFTSRASMVPAVTSMRVPVPVIPTCRWLLPVVTWEAPATVRVMKCVESVVYPPGGRRRSPSSSPR